MLKLFIFFMAFFSCIFIATGNVKAGKLTIVTRANDGTVYKPNPSENIFVVCYGNSVEVANAEETAEVNAEGSAILYLPDGRWKCYFTLDSDNVDKDASVFVEMTEAEHQYDLKTGLDNVVEKKVVKVSVTRKNEDGRNLAFASLQVINTKTNEVVKEWKSSSYTKTIELEAGSYVLKEVTAPPGYELAQNYSFEILESSEPITIDIVSSKLASDNNDNNDDNNDDNNINVNQMSLTVKYLDENNKYLKGATLRLLDDKGVVKDSWTTDTNAKVFPSLPLGFYTIEEVKAADGYASTQKVRFELATSGEMYTVTLNTSPVVKVPDTLSNTSKILIVISLAGLVIGAWLIYSNVKRREEI